MSRGLHGKSGSSLVSKISNASFKIILKDAASYLWTLRQAAHKSHASASHQEKTLRSLFQSMTKEQRAETIGLLRQMNDDVGSTFVTCLRINQSLRSSRTRFMTYPSHCDLTES